MMRLTTLLLLLAPVVCLGLAFQEFADGVVRGLASNNAGATSENAPATVSLPSVSIMMLTYKRPSLLPAALNMIAAQTYPRSQLEVLIVDDSPADDAPNVWPTLACSAGARALEGRVRYFRPAPSDDAPGSSARQTVGAKRNFAASVARGDLICVWDDDDFFPPNRLADAVAPIAGGSADVSFISGPETVCYFNANSGQFSRPRAAISPQPFHKNTMVYQRSLWRDASAGPTKTADGTSDASDSDGRATPLLTAARFLPAWARALTTPPRLVASAGDIKYPDVDLGEDTAFISAVAAAVPRDRVALVRTPWVHVRHAASVVVAHDEDAIISARGDDYVATGRATRGGGGGGDGGDGDGDDGDEDDGLELLSAEQACTATGLPRELPELWARALGGKTASGW